MIKAVLFDLDGTLLDTLEDLKDAVNYALSLHNLPIRSLDEIRNFVGNGVRHLMTRSTGGSLPSDDFERVFSTFTSYYELHSMVKTKPYEGIIELLGHLRINGFKIGIVSNKIQSAVDIIVPYYFPGLIDLAIGDTPMLRRKPAPDAVDHVIKSFGVHSSEVVFVGDSEVDLQTASAAHVTSIAVTWGFRTRDFLIEHGAVTLIDHPSQLKDFVFDH